MGLRLPLTTHLADRVRALLVDRAGWARFPDDVREWLEVQDWRSQLPGPDNLLVESFPHGGRHYTAYYTFAGWNANQALGMLITKRMEERGLLPGGFVANDYSLAVWGLKPVADPAPLLSPDILTHEFVDWVHRIAPAAPRVPRGGGDRRAGRAPASGQAQERQAGHLLDRPDLRRAAQVRARPPADRSRLGRRARADDRRRPARRPARHARPSDWSTSSSSGSARWRCRSW